jgi:DNA repair photolyase
MEKEFESNRKGTGTREWSDHSFNIMNGCIHNCIYCYAKADALYKYKSIAKPEDWTKPIVNVKKMNKNWEKLDGVIMFPTVHDITPDNVKQCTRALINMLMPGNDVLIVSKPCLETVSYMCTELEPYKEHILFRFTIGTTDNDILKLAEPGAPSFDERLSALKYAFEKGFRTSVSSEPLLGGISTALKLIVSLDEYITDTLWIGKMNKIDERVKIDYSSKDGAKIKKLIDWIKVEQSDKYIETLYQTVFDYPKIMWKDSIKEVMNLK